MEELVEQQVVDLAPFLAAIVQEAGGEVVIALSTLANLDAEQVALSIEPGEDQESLVISLVNPGDINYEQ